MRFPACRPATALRIARLRWSPDVVGRVRRPTNAGKRLAAIVVGSAAAGETMPRPPAQQAAAIGVPATDRSQALEEAVLGRLTARRLRAQSPAARDQSSDHHPDPH